jgi:hypothetical protein
MTTRTQSAVHDPYAAAEAAQRDVAGADLWDLPQLPGREWKMNSSITCNSNMKCGAEKQQQAEGGRRRRSARIRRFEWKAALAAVRQTTGAGRGTND